MRAVLTLFVLTLIAYSPASGRGIEHLADLLTSNPRYAGNARFEVLLPSAQDPVAYDVQLQSSATGADSLAPCSYLIRWTAQTPSGPNKGFSTYFDGNHYRYRNSKLQEYHAAESPAAFAPDGNIGAGVQTTAQFADILPQYLGEKLRLIASDSAYKYSFHPDTTVNGLRALAVDGTKFNNGYEAQQFLYAFNYSDATPLLIDITTSPGAISEQLITVTFSPADPDANVALSEQALIDMWPEVFEKYRQSTFRVESLIGDYLPDFSCRKIDGTSRLSHHRGDALERPAIIVAIDPKVASAPKTIQAVRQASDMVDADIIWAFTSNHKTEIEDLLNPGARIGETALPAAGSLLRNCGVTLYPTIILASSAGKVIDVISGHNQDLASVVIQTLGTSK